MDNYKEKYNKALRKALDLYNQGLINPPLEHIFPELKENDDERIRKAIHIYLDWLDGRKDYEPKGNYTIRQMLDWLEKQNEQKPADKIEPKTLNADKVIEWLKTHGNLVPVVTIKINEVIAKFKKDFGLC